MHRTALLLAALLGVAAIAQGEIRAGGRGHNCNLAKHHLQTSPALSDTFKRLLAIFKMFLASILPCKHRSDKPGTCVSAPPL